MKSLPESNFLRWLALVLFSWVDLGFCCFFTLSWGDPLLDSIHENFGGFAVICKAFRFCVAFCRPNFRTELRLSFYHCDEGVPDGLELHLGHSMISTDQKPETERSVPLMTLMLCLSSIND